MLDCLLGELGAAADRFNRYCLDHQLLCAVDETEACPVGLFERPLHRNGAAGRHDERRIGAGVAYMRAHEYPDLARRHTLAGNLGFCRFAK